MEKHSNNLPRPDSPTLGGANGQPPKDQICPVCKQKRTSCRPSKDGRCSRCALLAIEYELQFDTSENLYGPNAQKNTQSNHASSKNAGVTKNRSPKFQTGNGIPRVTPVPIPLPHRRPPPRPAAADAPPPSRPRPAAPALSAPGPAAPVQQRRPDTPKPAQEPEAPEDAGRLFSPGARSISGSRGESAAVTTFTPVFETLANAVAPSKAMPLGINKPGFFGATAPIVTPERGFGSVMNTATIGGANYNHNTGGFARNDTNGANVFGTTDNASRQFVAASSANLGQSMAGAAARSLEIAMANSGFEDSPMINGWGSFGNNSLGRGNANGNAYVANHVVGATVAPVDLVASPFSAPGLADPFMGAPSSGMAGKWNLNSPDFEYSFFVSNMFSNGISPAMIWPGQVQNANNSFLEYTEMSLVTGSTGYTTQPPVHSGNDMFQTVFDQDISNMSMFEAALPSAWENDQTLAIANEMAASGLGEEEPITRRIRCLETGCQEMVDTWAALKAHRLGRHYDLE